MKTLWEVVSRVAATHLTVRPSKCVIGTDSISFVVHHISQGCMKPNEENVRKVKNAPRLTTKKELRSFMGLTGFYRDYISNCKAIAVPWTDLTKKASPIISHGEALKRRRIPH